MRSTALDSHYEGVKELDDVVLPVRAVELTRTFELLSQEEADVLRLKEQINQLAILASTTDSFTSRMALEDAIHHGLHRLWVHSHNHPALCQILDELLCRVEVPENLVVEENGLYRLLAEEI